MRRLIRVMAGVTALACSFAATARAQSLMTEPSELPVPKYAKVFGQKIRYYEVGTGPTLVLVHGFASQARFDWGKVIVPLSKTHHVIALDQIGFGGSDKPAVDYSIQTFVDFLGEFLRVKHVDHFDLAGESLGGWVVADYTLQALEPTNTGMYALPKPSKLIMEDAAGHNAIHSPSGLTKVTGTLAESAGVAVIFFHKDWVTPEFVRENFTMKMEANDGQTQRLLRANPALDTETVGDKVHAITIPTLIVWGAEDHVVPLADGKDYAAKIPNSKLVIIPESGHVPSTEQPKAFLKAVNEFLK
ncbi:MAG: alpha/beta hydrolase [Acidobacteriaceae bacterium]|nr:alpha/beta hydrolase [Acidobacteriaceae bacterium]